MKNKVLQAIKSFFSSLLRPLNLGRNNLSLNIESVINKFYKLRNVSIVTTRYFNVDISSLLIDSISILLLKKICLLLRVNTVELSGTDLLSIWWRQTLSQFQILLLAFGALEFIHTRRASGNFTLLFAFCLLVLSILERSGNPSTFCSCSPPISGALLSDC